MLEHLRLTWKHHAKALIVASIFGLLAFAVSWSKLHIPVPATNVVTDPREIFVILGASLAGPYWGMLVGFLAGVNDPVVDSLWLSSVPRMIACIWVGWFSARFVWQRKRTRTMLLSWLLLVFSYYLVATAPTLLITYYVAPDIFATISPAQTGFFDTVAAVYGGWATEIVLTMVVTSLVVLILPRKTLMPFLTRRGSDSEPEEEMKGIRGGVFEGKLSLKLTAWFLLLAMIPLAVVTFFVQDDVARGFLLVGAGKQREIAREFSRECAKVGYQGALKERLVRTTGKTQNLFVVDKEGTYLAHILQDKVGRNMREDFLEASVQRILSGTTGVAAEHESGTSIGYAPIGGTEWRVVSVEGKEVIAHSLNDLQRTISAKLAISLLSIAVVWGIVIWLVVARPMRKLTMVTQEIGRGNLQATVEPSEMGGEIAVLAQAFNEMTGHLRFAYHETESEIAQRKSTEETLREREKQFRLLAENSTDMISRHDLEGRYLYASPACRSLLGAAPEEIVGRSAYDFVHPEDLDAVVAHHKAHLALGSAPPIIFRVRRIDGSTIGLNRKAGW